jgi:hypothetical protein
MIRTVCLILILFTAGMVGCNPTDHGRDRTTGSVSVPDFGETVTPCDPAPPDPGLLSAYLAGDYERLVSAHPAPVTPIEQALVAIAYCRIGQPGEALQFFPELPVRQRRTSKMERCFPHDELRKVSNCYEWVVLYHFYISGKSQPEAVCIDRLLGRYYLATPGKIDFLEAELYLDLARAGEGDHLLSEDMKTAITQLEEQFPDWEVPVLMKAYRYKQLEWYEDAAKTFKAARERGTADSEVFSNIFECYQGYTGIKDSSYYDERGRWKVKRIEVPAFAGESVSDSIEKYRHLSGW